MIKFTEISVKILHACKGRRKWIHLESFPALCSQGYSHNWTAPEETRLTNFLQADSKNPRISMFSQRQKTAARNCRNLPDSVVLWKRIHRNHELKKLGQELENINGTANWGHVEKSVVTEHALSDESHNVHFGEAHVLATTLEYRPWLIREAIENHKHDNNFNRRE